MKLIIGLGNPGLGYRRTRHNVGFMVVDKLNRGQKSEVRGQRILLARPRTYMNRSGEAVARLLRKHRLTPDDILIVCDDINLPRGKIRLRASGSAGGHNGLKSVIDSLGTDKFSRLRLGVGPAPVSKDTARYVLEKLDKSELSEIKSAIEDAAKASLVWAEEGVDKAMALYNRGQKSEDRRQI